MTYRHARLSGGYILHLLKPVSEYEGGRPQALCGRKPGGKTRMGIKRARWLHAPKPASDSEVCDDCRNAAKLRTQGKCWGCDKTTQKPPKGWIKFGDGEQHDEQGRRLYLCTTCRKQHGK